MLAVVQELLEKLKRDKSVGVRQNEPKQVEISQPEKLCITCASNDTSKGATGTKEHALAAATAAKSRVEQQDRIELSLPINRGDGIIVPSDTRAPRGCPWMPEEADGVFPKPVKNKRTTRGRK